MIGIVIAICQYTNFVNENLIRKRDQIITTVNFVELTKESHETSKSSRKSEHLMEYIPFCAQIYDCCVFLVLYRIVKENE